MIHPPRAGATDGAAFRDSHPSQTSPARRWRSDVGDVASPGSLVAALQHVGDLIKVLGAGAAANGSVSSSDARPPTAPREGGRAL